ncbi:MAG: DMT family transporter [Ruminiclostridium sp.]|nr:DMT family transporter [Ruminiclostridium sp.]
MKNDIIYPKMQAIIAAVLFGSSAPLAKLLTGDIDPVMLAALLYLGCGFGLFIYRGLQKFSAKQPSMEAGLTLKDMPWLAGAILAGGVAAPIILMFSLKNTPAATASLLLNFEGVSTSIIAAVAFREALGKWIWTAVAFITLASVILTWDTKGVWGFSVGAAGVVLSCIFWGMDNNFTRNISAKDPLSIVIIKGIAAGTISLIIALSTGNTIPSLINIFAALVLGFFSYGISIVLFILAMRSLGAARTSAFFGSAPFAGTAISLILFREWPGINYIFSLPVMIAGAVFILWENHLHKHKHERTEHEHRHIHIDLHHIHEHRGDAGKEHSHRHVHEEMNHTHSHTPDIHHRHIHNHE